MSHISIDLQYYLEDKAKKVNKSFTREDFMDILLSIKKPVSLDTEFLKRISQVAYERYLAQKIDEAPPVLKIIPEVLNKKETYNLLGEGLNYVLIFSAESIYFQGTIHAFAVDSYDFHKVNVLGVHKEWLLPDFSGTRRAILMDDEGYIREVAFENPVSIDVSHILHLPLRNEHKIHEAFSTHLMSIPQVNPYNASKRADNKACTHELWRKCPEEIVTPEYTLIKRGSSSKKILGQISEFICKIKASEVVVLPNNNTEGYKVEKFGSDELSNIVNYIESQVLPEDDAIVREKRGNVGFMFSNITLRINVAWNGREFVAESGYAQVARDENTFPASRGRGGKIVDINHALSCLYYFKDNTWKRFIPTEDNISKIKSSAVDAAYRLNVDLPQSEYLKFMGIDIILEANDTNMTPIFLEANPRPAGLAQSTEIIGISNREPTPLVSKGIFHYLILQERK
ncbi:hypothetical protein FJZ33_08920 [Candidatus Poribacteria bacterium]|nr:hypothetical protein [Candidatus Poribacteria bacterium]